MSHTDYAIPHPVITQNMRFNQGKQIWTIPLNTFAKCLKSIYFYNSLSKEIPKGISWCRFRADTKMTKTNLELTNDQPLILIDLSIIVKSVSHSMDWSREGQPLGRPVIWLPRPTGYKSSFRSHFKMVHIGELVSLRDRKLSSRSYTVKNREI